MNAHEARSGLLRGIRNALLIEAMLAGGILIGMAAVRWPWETFALLGVSAATVMAYRGCGES